MQGSILDRTRVNAWDLSEYQQFINACQRSIPASEFLGLYFPRKNFIISAATTGTMEFMLHDALVIESMSKEDLDTIIGGIRETQSLHYKTAEIFQYGKKKSGLLVFISVLKLPDQPSPGAVLISFIPDEQLFRAMDSIRDSNEFVSLAVWRGTESGEAMYQFGASSAAKGAIALEVNSEVPGWNYELTVSRSALLRDISYMRNILFFIVGSILLVCLLMSALFTTSLYRPIRETLGLLSINTVKSGNELEQIKSSIALLKDRREELEEMAKEHLPLLLSYYYSSLLLGPPEERLKNVEELEKLLGRHYPLNRAGILISMTPTGAALLPKPALMVQAEMGQLDHPVDLHTLGLSGRTVLILRYGEEADYAAWRAAVCETFPGAVVAAGGPSPSIAGLYDSYKDANREAGFALAGSDLMIALRMGNRAGADSIIHAMLEDADNEEKGPRLEQLFRAISDHVDSPPEDEPSAELRDWAFRHIENICASPQDKAIDAKFLIELVDSSIQNPNLSLQYIADRFGVSVSLISKAFKETESAGFNHYVNRRRMELAKDILAAGYDIAAAARMTGYSNDTTFRRCFKDFYGLTPTEYRQELT
jgi:AraC-like DNA-binding protein